MRSVFRQDGLVESRATLALVQSPTFFWCSLSSIIGTAWLLLALFASPFVTRFTQVPERRLSRRDCLSPSLESSAFRWNRMYCSQMSRQSGRLIYRPSR